MTTVRGRRVHTIRNPRPTRLAFDDREHFAAAQRLYGVLRRIEREILSALDWAEAAALRARDRRRSS